MPINMNDKLGILPFLSQTTGVQRQVTPAAQPMRPTGFSSGQVSFGHLAGVSKNGPGALLQPENGKSGLENRAIMTQNGELGRNLFISA